MKILEAQRKAFKKEKSEAIKQATDPLIQSFRKEIKSLEKRAKEWNALITVNLSSRIYERGNLI